MEHIGQFLTDARRILTIEFVEARRVELRISMQRMCDRAGYHITSYDDWKRHRYQPRADRLIVLLETLDQLRRDNG